MYGYDLPIGTWMLTSYIENDDVWAKIKAGEVKGYSIEGVYTDKLLQQSEETIIDEVEQFQTEMELYGTDEEKALYKQIVDLIESIDDEEIQ